MARVIAIGQPVNDSEREAIAYLRDHLSNAFVVIQNFEIKQGHELYEIDIALLAPHCVFVIDVKGTRGLVDVFGNKWYPEGRGPYHSPLAILRSHAKALKTLICDQHPANASLKKLYITAAVLMTAPDARVVDPGGKDGPSVAYLKKCVPFFQDMAHVPAGYSNDIRAQLGIVETAIIGRAKPKTAPPCYGTWQIEDRLGGTERYTEYRARHTLLGDRRGGSARLRVYQVDPYLPEDEQKRQHQRIGNAFNAIATLPGHPNILAVREFFPTEDRDRLILVTEDVAGHALRQHIKKDSLALTYDQKINVVRDVLAALDHAHRGEPQVVHRNLTSDAVLVSTSGRSLLCGFDYARAGKDRRSTIAHEIVDELDPLCQAPECYRDPAQATVASDLFSAGVVFYELFVGDLPYASLDDMMDKDGRFPVKPSAIRPELPPSLDEWLQALCAFDVEDRPASAAVALARFNAIVGPDPRETGRPQPPAPEPPAPVLHVDYQNLERDFEIAERFRVEERLGSGGFAVAYKVFDSFSDTSRVLKLIVKDRRSTFERLRQEYRILERLAPHRNVVRVVWADKLPDETPYIVFEYLPGNGVDDLLQRHALSSADVKRIGEETAAGLEHLHASGVFHRDIKPSNLLWTDQGIRIIDFNVAALKDDEDARPGGTRRYIPPDIDLSEPLTPVEEADRDLYALGITLYECVSGGKYPWEASVPLPDTQPRDPREFVADLSPEFAQLILRAIAPRHTGRFGSVREFREALAAVSSVTIIPVASARESAARVDTTVFPVAGPTRPNFNPFVSHLLTMHGQNPNNKGTRGLDDASEKTYVRTMLDDRLRPAVLAGEFGLVIVSGNAGDGKTAFIQKIERSREIRPLLQQRPNGTEFVFHGRRFLTNYDGSQDENEKVNDDVLLEFLGPFQGNDPNLWPTNETRIIAINEGRLVDFLMEQAGTFPALKQLVHGGLVGASPTNGIVTVNLNLRSVVAIPEESKEQGSIFDRLLRSVTREKFWEPCAGCDIRDRCYIYHNAKTFMDPVAGPQITERLRTLYTVSHLRGRLHITMRDARSALAFTLAGTRDCDQVHALYAASNPGARRAILEGFYFNSWRGGEGSEDRLLSLLREIDVGRACNPGTDRALDYLPPDAREMARFSFANRGSYDSLLLERLYRELPRDSGAGTAVQRVELHQEYVAMLRRRQFFEQRDENWKEMLPYRTADEFWGLVTGRFDPSGQLSRLLLAINRGEGLSDPRRLGNVVALRVRVVERGTVRSYRLFPGDSFRLVIPSDPGNLFVEHIPQALKLIHTSAGGQEAELLVNLDIYEMLGRLSNGYRPSLEELHGYYLSLAVFKNVLSSAPYQEVLLTRTGHDFFRIRRAAQGTLHLEPVKGGVG